MEQHSNKNLNNTNIFQSYFRNLVDKRFSCRKFLNQPVEREKIVQCIESARVSPSACNAQPWKFIVVDDIELKQKVVQEATSGIYKISKFLSNAPVIILVLADKGSFLSRAGSLVRNTRFYLIDIGIVCQQLVLQATELGLGSCYVGWFNEKPLKKIFNIPKSIEIPLLICLGYPDEEYKTKDPIRRRAGSELRKPLEEIVFFNSYK
jgi:nitroreductase